MKKQKNLQKNKKPNIGTYLAHYKFPIFLYILSTIIIAAANMLETIVAAQALVRITEYNFHDAIMTVLLALLLDVVARVLIFLNNLLYFKYSNKIMAEVNLDLAAQAFKLNSQTFDNHETGTFVRRIVYDPEQIITSLLSLIEVVISLLGSLAMAIYLATLNIWTSLVFVLLWIISGILEYFRIKKRRTNRKIVNEKNDKIQSLTTEIIKSEKDIKSLGLEAKLSEVSKQRYEDARKAHYKTDLTNSTFWSVRNLILHAGSVGVIILGIWLMDQSLMTMAVFMLVYSNRHAAWSFVMEISNIINIVQDMKISHKRMFALFDEKEFVTERFGKKKLNHVSGKIEFKDVSFVFREYENPKNNKENEGKKPSRKESKNKENEERKVVSENKVFSKLSFKVEPNATVAFVGKSGSGKSTILNLMSKMYDAESGEVLIDDVNIQELSKETIRKSISLVNQFPYIFDMTIKENLLLAKSNASDKEINEAIKNAALDEFIAGLPKGIDSKVGEGGIKLSGGQRQRLAIARAFLRKSSIILFDESTSSLDNFAQEDIKKSIERLKGKSTVVIVAHRLSTIRNADTIYFIDAGQVVDQGTFDELFKRNKTFKAMFMAENI